MIEFLLIDLPIAIVLYVVGVYYLQDYLLKQRAETIQNRADEPVLAGQDDVHSDPTLELEEEEIIVPPAFLEPLSEDAKPCTHESAILGCHVPVDATLRRHFGGHVLSMLVTIHGGKIPEDQTLRRHVTQLVSARFDCVLTDAGAYEALVKEYEAL
jgi:hypothetical protein